MSPTHAVAGWNGPRTETCSHWPPRNRASSSRPTTDFGELLAKSGADTPSFVLLRKTDGLSADEIANLLASNLPAFESELNEGAILVITNTTVRIRALPV